MKSFTYIITDENGIHARPAGLLIKKAAEFSSDITITFGSRTADAKKIFSVMSLCAKQNDEITVVIDGSDEEKAFSSLQVFLKENL